jgi:hypothetical protein
MESDNNQRIRAAVLIALSAHNATGIVSETPRATPPVVTVSKRQGGEHAPAVDHGPEWNLHTELAPAPMPSARGMTYPMELPEAVYRQQCAAHQAAMDSNYRNIAALLDRQQLTG